MINKSREFIESYWGMFRPPTPSKVVDQTNAKYVVTKRQVIDTVYYSDAESPMEARVEGTTAFNIGKKGVRTTITSVDYIVEENNDSMVDGDGYDTVTGITQYPRVKDLGK